MKKFHILLSAAFLLAIYSCTKTYNCECTHQDTLKGPDSLYTSVKPIKADQSEAEAECETYEYFYDTSPYQAFSTCELKP